MTAHKLIIFVIFLTFSLKSSSQTAGMFFVRFTDKNDTGFSPDRPLEFLSERSVQRRVKQNIPINETDLPVSQKYIDSLSTLGIPVANRSKWFNSVTTKAISSSQAEIISQLGFVKEIKLVKPVASADTLTQKSGASSLYLLSSPYGYASRQIEIHHGNLLHNAGYSGKGVHIAVLDAGFSGADTIRAFQDLWQNGQVLGFRDFVDPSSNIFSGSSHGTSVLSAIGGHIPGMFSGTAPEASFWLLRSEDTRSEYPVEEYNWISAAEFADSAGVDIINSSLGYSSFDDPSFNYSYSDMDGNTAAISIAADMAAAKGILVVTSAGNLGNDPWKYISAPADADSVLAVGAVDMDGLVSDFSSRGPGAKGNIKPNISAVGKGAFIIRPTGAIAQGNGTSFSSPIIAGLAACLWQAHPGVTNMQIKEAIEKSSSRHLTPDSLYGYGIPDFYKAFVLLRAYAKIANNELKGIEFFPNPFSNYPVLAFNSEFSGEGMVLVYNLMGGLVAQIPVSVTRGLNLPDISVLTGLNQGTYILKFEFRSRKYKTKIIKY
jgi:serine protease AprX